MTISGDQITTAALRARKAINPVRRYGLTRLLFSIMLVAIATGCATPGMVSYDQSTINPDFSVIAFSVNANEWTEEDVWVRPKQLLLRIGDEPIPVRLIRQDDGPQRILMEVPAREVAFDWYELNSGAGIFWKQYVSDIGQSFQLTQGRVNYLGRIEIEDVAFDAVDGEERRQPVGIKLVFADALAEDLDAWRQSHRLFNDHVPRQQVIGQIEGPEYLDVWADEFYGPKPNTRWTRPPPTRKVTPERKPRPTRPNSRN